ncbi:MAG: hypothetical protein M1814_001575 [Vezdaea aestivalis]|nr:MAG: hypothetical protein M1814_001575 [Vezdaea aestivalis]
MIKVDSTFIAAGGNRHPAAADWDVTSGLLAFGAGKNIAIWRPLDKRSPSIISLLKGHTDTVNAVKFFSQSSQKCVIISGSVDKTIRIWVDDPGSSWLFDCHAVLEEHKSSINCLAICDELPYFFSGSADASIILWSLSGGDQIPIACKALQKINLTPRYFPLALAVHPLDARKEDWVLAAAGTETSVQLFAASFRDEDLKFEPQASLSGHEGWIRSLVLVQQPGSQALLLASASQDKYVRLWKLQEIDLRSNTVSKPDSTALGKFISIKAQYLRCKGKQYSASFDALLLGHDDWVYSTSWKRKGDSLRLLSASADNTLSVWEADPSTGIWLSTSRLGEISAQKGATTATGSAGGYWTGLWSPDGGAVASLGKTGGWRLWANEPSVSIWNQMPAISGHVKAVKGIAWSKGSASYLISTSSDQTTRLLSQWKQKDLSSWHEFSRPQIHGYDLNCVDTLTATSFVSGADEKLLRVFDMPKSLGATLKHLSQVEELGNEDMPETADMPVLGLSNKAIQQDDDMPNGHDEQEVAEKAQSSVLEHAPDQPPLEDSLSKYTLWPEKEKLYGHGYEISAVATSHDSTIIATACRASSIDHAVIRLFRTNDWREVTPSLRSHSLTVARLRFSPDDKYLLSVGRDRQWTLFRRNESDPTVFQVAISQAKGHSRMILDATWAPLGLCGEDIVFATAGRDKMVKIWRGRDQTFDCAASITFQNVITAIAFLPTCLGSKAALAAGTENGLLKVGVLDEVGSDIQMTWHEVDERFENLQVLFVLVHQELILSRIAPSAAVNQIAWRPPALSEKSNGFFEVAVASEDHSVRIYSTSNLDSMY